MHLSRSWVKHKKTWKSRLEADIMRCMLHTVTVKQYIASYDMLLSCQVHCPSKKKSCWLVFWEGRKDERVSMFRSLRETTQKTGLKLYHLFFLYISIIQLKHTFIFFILRKTSLLSDCGLLPPSETYSQLSSLDRGAKYFSIIFLSL